MHRGRYAVAACVGALACGLSTVAAAGAAAPPDPPARLTRIARSSATRTWHDSAAATTAPADGPVAAAAAPSISVSDPTGDVPDARGDVNTASSGADTHTSVFTIRVQTPTDPLTDDNWTGDTGPIWVIDSNYNRIIDYIAAVFRSPTDEFVAILFDGNITPVCEGVASYDGVDYIARFAGGCPRLRSYQWSAEMDYDLTPGGPSRDEQIDAAPDARPSSPTPLHRNGYWMMGSDGKLYEFGNAPHFSSNVPYAFGLEARRDGTGVWITDVFGGVRTYGSAKYKGGHPSLRFGELVTTISATPTNNGYWLFTNLGRVFPFGDAKFYGDMRNRVLNGPVIASVATANGHGYYMVGTDGGIFTFGNAQFHGSMGGKHLNGPVVGIAPTPDGSGYWLVGNDGGVFAFHAPFRGSMGGRPLNEPVNGLVAYGNGYLMVAADGGVFDFSNKPYLGSLGGKPLSAPIFRIAAFST